MDAAQVDPLVGLPYCADTFDCADFVVHVQQVLFGRTVQLPNGRPRGSRGMAALTAEARAYGTPTTTPHSGDLVLLKDAGQRRAGHVGVFLHLAHENWILHNDEVFGGSVLQRAWELTNFGCTIEGYYTWNL